MKIKFSVITPTIGRDSLKETVASIDNQNYKELEHIIIYDGGPDKIFKRLCREYNNGKNRFVFNTKEKFADYGNTPKWFGAKLAYGDYIAYIDDDDTYTNDTFNRLNKFLNELADRMPSKFNRDNIITSLPNFIVFPCLRFNNIFYTLPPQNCHTVSNQYIHKREVNGEPIRFSELPNGLRHTGYTADGAWIEDMCRHHGFIGTVPIEAAKNSDCLVIVDKISEGK